MVSCSTIGVLAFVILARYCEGQHDNPGKVRITPTHSVVRQNESQSITCDVGQRINGCQFLLRDYGNKWDAPIIDVTIQRVQNILNIPHSHAKVTLKSHYVPNGTCTLNLGVLPHGRYLVGCRLLIAQQWHYEFVSHRVSSVTFLQPMELDISLTNNHVVQKKGDNFTIQCETRLNDMQLYACYFFVPGDTSQINFYDEDAFKNGKCQHSIQRLEEEHNGVYWCDASTISKTGGAAIPLIVPSKPTVRLQLDKTSYKIGDTLSATCTVTGARPAPTTMEWCLGGRENSCNPALTLITSGNDLLKEDWKWPWVSHNITKTTTFEITKGHNGTLLFCRVTNDYWGQLLDDLTINIIGEDAVRPRVAKPAPSTTTPRAKTTSATPRTTTAVALNISTTSGPTAESSVDILITLLSTGFCISVIMTIWLYLRQSRLCLCFRVAESIWEPAVVSTQDTARIITNQVEDSPPMRAPCPLPRPGQEQRDSYIYNEIRECPEYLEILSEEDPAVEAQQLPEAAAPDVPQEPNHYDEPYDHVFIPYLWPPPDRPLPSLPGTQPGDEEDPGYLTPKMRRKL